MNYNIQYRIVREGLQYTAECRRLGQQAWGDWSLVQVLRYQERYGCEGPVFPGPQDTLAAARDIIHEHRIEESQPAAGHHTPQEVVWEGPR